MLRVPCVRFGSARVLLRRGRIEIRAPQDRPNFAACVRLQSHHPSLRRNKPLYIFFGSLASLASYCSQNLTARRRRRRTTTTAIHRHKGFFFGTSCRFFASPLLIPFHFIIVLIGWTLTHIGLGTNGPTDRTAKLITPFLHTHTHAPGPNTQPREEDSFILSFLANDLAT